MVKGVYKLTKGFPREEKYGLVSQINRSAVSIPTNIAEGVGRATDADFARFLDMAYGSSFELETLLLLSTDVGICEESEINQLQKTNSIIQRKLYQLRKSVLSRS